MTKSPPARSLSEGALLAILTGGLFLSSYYLPLIGVFLGFLCPLPIIVMLIKHDFRSGLIVVLTATLLVTMLSGPILGIVYLLGFAIVGLTMGESIKHEFSPLKVIVINTGVAVVCGLLLIGSAFSLMGRNPLKDFQQELSKSSEYSLDLYSKMGIDSAKISEMENSFELLAGFISIAFPALFLISMGVNVLVVFLVAQYFLTRLNYPVRQMGSFSSWRLPDYFVWLFIAGFLLYFSRLEYLKAGGLNLIVIVGIVYFIQGLSIIQFFFKEKHIPGWGRLLFYGIFFISPPLAIILVIASVFDLWVDFRRLMISKGEV